MRKILLLFNTVKYLKFSQILYRIIRKVHKPRVTDNAFMQPIKPSYEFVFANLFDQKIKSDLQATFLNCTRNLDLPSDWNNSHLSKLWLYNLHYFEDLVADESENKHVFHVRLLSRWQKENAVGFGNGWEPYPTSLRIVNVLKAWLGGLPLEREHFKSIYAQASYLSNDLEKHLLGNHYFVNLKALLYAGVVFGNKRWKNTAVRGLLKQIPEQILDDGANFELSPMYHSLILVDMLDMINLAKTYPDNLPLSFVKMLDIYSCKMLDFMELMSHNDGGVSFFNDSAEGIAPSKERIRDYASQLGLESKELLVNETQVIDSQPSGYMIATNSGNKLLFDAAAVGPDYIPGHAHADTLSFELSIGKQRVFVNSGTSQYGLGPQRLTERKTAAHNTVEVDGTDSSQVWSAFRVAKRAKVISRSSKVAENEVVLSATHDGYKRIINGPLHTRTIVLAKNKLSVVDQLVGNFESAVARFYFHPSISLSLNDGTLKASGARLELTADLAGKNARVVNTKWHPEFGLSIKNQCLEVTFTADRNQIDFMWIKK